MSTSTNPDGPPVHVRGQARTVLPQRALNRGAGPGLGRGQVGDTGQEQHFRVPGVDEARAFVDGADVRPGVRQPVHGGGGQRTVGVARTDVPAGQLGQAGAHELVSGLLGVGEEGRRRLVHEPVDPTRVPVALADLGIGAVAEQMGRCDDIPALFGDEGDPLAHPRVGDELVRLPFQRAQDGVHRDGDTGDDSGDVRIDQIGQLVAVGTVEGTYFGHG